MKLTRLIFILAVLVVTLAACTAPSAPVQPAQAYPEPKEILNPTQPSVLYPGLRDGDRADWDLVLAMMINGEVAKIVMSADLQITLTLKDGRSLIAIQPNPESVTQALEICGEPCKTLEVITE